MISTKHFLAAALCAWLTLLTIDAAEPKQSGPKDAGAVLSALRLKNITTALALNDEQRKKVAVLFEEETKATTRLREDTAMPITERNTKIKELQEATYAKMKPLLTPEQSEKLDKLRAPKKKKA